MARSAEPCELIASTVINCPVQQCWDCYIDNQLTAQWSPAVVKIDCEQPRIELGITRKSHVRVTGKDGHTVEQCTLFEPLKRIDFTILEETFGFSHMLNSYGFSVSFDVDGSGTLMMMNTHYVPKKIFASVMSSAATQQQIHSLMNESLLSFTSFMQNR